MPPSATPPEYQCFELERGEPAWFAQLHGGHHEEAWIHLVGEELVRVIDEEGCRRLVLSFGEFECLYSLLMGKMMTVRRAMERHGGRMKLCDVPPQIREVFRICRLEEFFEFVPDRAAAMASW